VVLETANTLGIRGVSAFKGMAGFGRHHKLTEEKFFELAGTSVIEIEFIVTDQEAQQLFNLMHAHEPFKTHVHIASHLILTPHSGRSRLAISSETIWETSTAPERGSGNSVRNRASPRCSNRITGRKDPNIERIPYVAGVASF
jgi:PII-like signaling protein